MTAADLIPALVLFPLLAAAVCALLPAPATKTIGMLCGVSVAAMTAVVVAPLTVHNAAVHNAAVHNAAVPHAATPDTADSPGATDQLTVALADWAIPLGIELRVDAMSAVFLALTAAVGAAISVYALDDRVTGGRFFWPLWLALWAGLNAVYVSGDLFNIYVALELLTLAAVSLVALGGRSAAAPALRYLFIAVVGSLLFLLAVALLYGQTGTLDLQMVAERAESGTVLAAALALAAVGLATKMALFPGHTWLPVAHPAAPAAVSAALSALVVKASLYVIWRLWSTLGTVEPAATTLASGIGVLGAVAVFFGGAMALRRRKLKQIIAYSTIAQVGYLAVVLALVTSSVPPEAAVAGWTGGLLLVLAHGVAKAAMFMAAGTLTIAYGSDRLSRLTGAVSAQPLAVSALAIGGISLAGLPPTFGFVAKWHLLSSAVGSGQWWWIPVLLVGGLLTFAYTAKMIRATFNPIPEEQTVPRVTTVPMLLSVVPFVLALASVVLGFFAADVVGAIASGVGGEVG